MRVHFVAPAPRFGRTNNRLPIGYQQRSPYYWWWAYLRRNEDYLKTCELGGRGRFEAIYSDFGDVRDDDFRKWWREDDRGARLFGERPLEVRFQELESPDQWGSEWNKSEVMVIAVPLRVAKRQLKGLFNMLLDNRHTGTRGRPKISKINSSANYKLAQNYTIRQLDLALTVFDLWKSQSKMPESNRLSLWEIGERVNANPKAAKLARSEFTDERLTGRNILGATVSRYLNQAKHMIENAGYGVFPLHAKRRDE